MIKPDFFNKSLLNYLLKFLLAFCICYYGTLFVMGVSAPGGYYIAFIRYHLDYINWLRTSLLCASKWMLSLFGYQTYLQNQFFIRLKDGAGVRMVYSCLGIGVMSFWTAFIFANSGSWIKKTKWILGGLVVIWCINVIRISLLLIAINKHGTIFFNIYHHTLFNIVAYTAIFLMIYLFDKSTRRPSEIGSH
jgi:exosortase/archaeosortase family protein